MPEILGLLMNCPMKSRIFSCSEIRIHTQIIGKQNLARISVFTKLNQGFSYIRNAESCAVALVHTDIATMLLNGDKATAKTIIHREYPHAYYEIEKRSYTMAQKMN